MSTKNSEIKPIEYSYKGKKVTFNTPLLMAIVNVTPDSFYDGGRYDTNSDILHDVEEKVKQGAHIIDLGAASSRPNAPVISESEEWDRLKEVLPQIRKNFPDTILSVDTYRASIAQRSADAGIDMINDIGGGTLDTQMFSAVAKLQLPYVLMHIQGNPQTMQLKPNYSRVVDDVKNHLKAQIKQLHDLHFHKIIVDPGFGFGKELVHNYQLLKELSAFEELNCPLLAGVSRKGMINKVIGTNPVTALNGTTVLNTIALLNGASILRVHDVNEAKQALELVSYYRSV